MSTTLVCQVRRRLPIAVVAMYGTLDQGSVVRALVTLRDCLAEAPIALLLDVGHLLVTSPAALRPIVSLARDARVWPAATVGLCGATTALQSVSAELSVGTDPAFYPSVDAGVNEALRTPVAPRESLVFAPNADAPAKARAFVESTCHAWGIARVAKLAALIASELATNAVVHARTRAVMVLRLTADALHVSVRDKDPRPMYRPAPGASGANESDHGRGLLILEAMSDSWGCHPTADGKVVWATVSTSPPSALVS